MKTSYQILWIDDDPPSVDTDRQEVGEFLEEFGIRADITFVEAPDDGSIKEKIEHHLKDPDLDLLMVDYHMEGLKGDELVKLIRETDHVYLPVIFYSSSPIEQIFEAVSQSKLDGVYIANRDFFMNKVKEVVQSLLVKEQTSKQTRGLLMEGVSEIDALFSDVLAKAWATANDENKEKIRRHLQTIVCERSKNATNNKEKFPENLLDFEKHLENCFLTPKYDTSIRWRVVRKLLELVGQDNIQLETLKIFADPSHNPQSLNSLRNDYAHKTREVLEKDHSEERCVQIRRSLREQLANIDKILARK